MITILHGDDEMQVHKELTRLMTQAKQQGIQVVHLAAKEISIPDLESTIGTQELFAAEKLVVIDRLHSLPKSKRKEELIDWITMQKSEVTHIVFVENKILTPTMLKKISNAQVQLYKLPSLVFTFIDALGTQPSHRLIPMFHQILDTQDPEFVFTMIVRQIRTLLAYVADGVYEGPPFGRAKIQKQAQTFTIEQLRVLHSKLLDIDQRQKTSRASLTLVQEIDLLLTEA